MRNLGRFIPPALKAIDRQLLLNRPTLWATRFHYVTFFGIVIWALISFKLGTFSLDISNVPNIDIQAILLLIPAFISIAFWAYQAHLFSSRRLFGQMNQSQEIRNQLIFLGGVLLIGGAPIIYGTTLSHKIADATNAQELIADINTLNLGDQFFLIHNSYPYQGQYNYFSISNGFINYAELNRMGHIRSYNEVERMGRSASRCSQKRYIQAYKEVLRKYSGHELQKSNSKILELYNWQNRSWGKKLVEARKSTRSNLQRLTEVKAQAGVFQLPSSLQSFFFALLMISMAIWIFVKSNWKYFLGTVALVVGLLIFISLSASLISWSTDSYHTINLRPLDITMGLIAVIWGLLLWQGVTHTRISNSKYWPSMALMANLMLLPFLILYSITLFYENIFHSDFLGKIDGQYILLGVFLGMGFLWNVMYAPRLNDLHAGPKSV